MRAADPAPEEKDIVQMDAPELAGAASLRAADPAEQKAKRTYETYAPEETFSLGREMALRARPGEIWALTGDLGAGKTAFTQGAAKGLGVREAVVSPTFTLLQIYESGRMPLYHFDVYRVADAEEMLLIGCEEYFYGDGLCIIEWADLIPEILPPDCVRIGIETDPLKGYDYRRITVTSTKECPA